MTKVEAIERVLKQNGGSANLNTIYEKIQKFYPKAKQSSKWEAGIRGVLYREIKEGNRFKKIGISIYALKDYEENTLQDYHHSLQNVSLLFIYIIKKIFLLKKLLLMEI